jgi:hypothetical protein
MAALFNFAPQYPPITSTTEAITATPGGTQAAGFQLVSRYNRVSVCATGGDSVVLPPMNVADTSITVSNDGAAALNVFPYPAQQISSGAVNAAFSVPAAKTAMFIATGTSNKWAILLSA